ncbi:chitobiase/beta-hexosaminidase C-terminal domain-containing protein [Paludicola sp. MB14-C6]|uniref:chitobiase/beta-hexosaminidase C-terminal domain-containing protein n=1 Tax=Paludihabitans sp. MB14-C6 TaxID=3070656 RepID=UPI0027DAC316|nr:chitobiase/beta-hexosaminidase C-terminal domain-containing protein [Paludicola sp. MB14-C6]WMJ23511.1 chitobiase/beta-hexosaminidase C-terminal domain-containing protein [Paludicola sp. MB14-C6]
MKKIAKKISCFLLTLMLVFTITPFEPLTAADTIQPWTVGTAYKVNSLASYNNNYYQCRQAHTAIEGWEPPNVPALWKEYTGSIPNQTVATPLLSLPNGNYSSKQDLSITCATAGATIRYTTDGSEPTANSTVYTQTLWVTSTVTVKAKAFKSGMNPSPTATGIYTYGSQQTVATPLLSLPNGNYSSKQDLSITCATAGATIRYTTDGSEPTANSTVYTQTLWVTSTVTVKAKAFKSGMNPSATATGIYTYGSQQTVATPLLSLPNGNYSSKQDLSITCATAGATIRYTTDGSEPTVNSTVYTQTLWVTSTVTVKAKAFKSGMNPSATATGIYTYGSTPTNFRVVGYYPSWQPDKLNRIQYDIVTHINYSFLIPTADGSVLPLEGANTARTIIQQAHANNVKVLIAVGGWSYQDIILESTFVSATNTDAKIAKFTSAIMKVVTDYGFDGVDIDWEHPRYQTASQTQYEKLMVSLNKELKKTNRLLTSAVIAGVTPSGTPYYDAAAHSTTVFNAVDWFNVMAYDGGDGINHSSYNFAINCANYWKNARQMPANKVVLGVPFYGRPSWASYDEILVVNPNAYSTDTSYINGVQAYYNGIPTIQAKTRWAKQNIGGVMIWELSHDTLDRNKSLLSAIGRVVKE